MAVKKKTKKKTTKKKVSRVSKVSSNNITTSGFEPVNESDIFKNFENEFSGSDNSEIRKVFIDGFRHYQQAKLKAENGEFRGDFTRETFDSCNGFSKVLMQQGRVQLDADWNEQTSITAHHIRSLACDIGSEHWGPHKGAGFALNGVDNNAVGILVSPGHYYVNGILCEVGLGINNELISYVTQPYYTVPDEEMPNVLKNEITENKKKVLVYLDVWERHYNYINDDLIREVALGGPDTATRAKIVWQIKALAFDDPNNEISGDNIDVYKRDYQQFLERITSVRKIGTGRLCAKVKDKSGDDTDPCLVAPESRYRGAENQLYRVEIHQSGVADHVAQETGQQAATFKWSRENSSVIFPITEIQANVVSLEHLGKDCRYGLQVNDWVEIVDDDLVLQCRADNLVQVESIDKENRQITLSSAPDTLVGSDSTKHPYLRRWDHSEGGPAGIPVKESVDGQLWLDIEDGIQVQFSNNNELTDSDGTTDADGTVIDSFNANHYQTGDYWLIPARTITGDIEWPKDSADKSKCVHAHGVIHHYAPLAIFGEDPNGNDIGASLRRILKQAWE